MEEEPRWRRVLRGAARVAALLAAGIPAVWLALAARDPEAPLVRAVTARSAAAARLVELLGPMAAPEPAPVPATVREPIAPAVPRARSGALDGRAVLHPRSPAEEAHAAADPAPSRARAGPAEALWLPAGTVVRAAPSANAGELGRSERVARAQVLERRDGWARVWLHRERQAALAGWVVPLPPAPPGEPPLGRATEPPRPLPARPPDPARLAAALALLGEEARELPFGPYRGWSDVGGAEALAALARVAAQVEPAYRARLGIEPLGAAAEAVVVFAVADDYERYKAGEREIAQLPAAGHASLGLVAVAHGERPTGEVAAVLVHEIAHLLNRRALGPALPPWLDEGIADALALSRIGADGTLDPAALGGTARRDGNLVHVGGGWAAAQRLRRSLAGQSLEQLPRLLALDWREFVAPQGREERYAESAFFVRFLLDSGDPVLAEGFRRYLEGVAAGGDAAPEALRASLGAAWPPLAARFRIWLEQLEREVTLEVRAAG
jgi:hypothetical protein